MTLSCEAHGPISTQNGSRSFLLAGNGIRMAQDMVRLVVRSLALLLELS